MSDDALAKAFMSGDPEERKAESLKAKIQCRKKMEAICADMRDIVLACPPRELIAYLWSRLGRLMLIPVDESGNPKPGSTPTPSQTNPLLSALEYTHAVLASFKDGAGDDLKFDPKNADRLVGLAEELSASGMVYGFASAGAAETQEEGEMIQQTVSAWQTMRGHRYQVLEEEFFQFVLAPHDEALKKAYGISAAEIASIIQSMSNVMREGMEKALAILIDGSKDALAATKGDAAAQKAAVEKYAKENPEKVELARSAADDLFMGGLCNMKKHTKAPPILLEDLSYQRGGNFDFYAPGDYVGTPIRTLPARIKPLIQLGDDYFATEPNFPRDSSYRTIQRSLLQRLPEYREEWNRKQAKLAETAFETILQKQLPDAEIFHEVYYKDPTTGEWVENDTLILIGDVLIQIEGKAGATANSPPSTNLERHIKTVDDLVVAAYRQTKRFLEYANSSRSVKIYQRIGGKYTAVRDLELARYRVILPIGLTMESFTPFSSFSKELPEIQPILGLYPFISMSVDDLFVLGRFLPTAGELLHYLAVRQRVAGLPRAMFFDELDHLGGYIEKNRIDLVAADFLKEGYSLANFAGMSDPIDQFFSLDQWKTSTPPSPHFPGRLRQVLNCLAIDRRPGWLAGDAHLRDFSGELREQVGDYLEQLAQSLAAYPTRSIVLAGKDELLTLLIWVQRIGADIPLKDIDERAAAAAIALGSPKVAILTIEVAPDLTFSHANYRIVPAPSMLITNYAELKEKGEAMKSKFISLNPPKPNDPCHCGSGKRYKRCHGRGKH